ncbi:MAG: UDP-N-acetylglucosamine 4,6-dehydratase family protein [Candidatus Paceibacterota bacterium]|jgi:FlaA1/EpsC-like NDP-sugar epimerase
MKEFKDKIVLVTGGTGSIGSEIVRQLLKADVSKIRIYSRDEHKQHELRQELGANLRLTFLLGDVRDKDRLDFAFKGVDICFHAAALKHVPFCEYNPFEALKTNAIGTQNVIDVSIRNNLEKVIAISTDKAVSPESVLGASKLMAERLIAAANLSAGSSRTKFACVRFGNVVGSRGSVIHLWQRQIEEGGPVTVTHKKVTRFFMEIPQAVGLIFDAVRLMRGGEIFVLKMKKHRIADFALEVIKKFSNGKKIAIKFIGLRPGEKLDEELFTNEERSHMLETKDMYIITPQHILPGYEYPSSNYPGSRKAVIRR